MGPKEEKRTVKGQRGQAGGPRKHSTLATAGLCSFFSLGIACQSGETLGIRVNGGEGTG